MDDTQLIEPEWAYYQQDILKTCTGLGFCKLEHMIYTRDFSQSRSANLRATVQTLPQVDLCLGSRKDTKTAQ